MKIILISLIFLAFAYINANDKVKLNLYYESLCGPSKYFVNNLLYPTYKNLSSIIELKLFPFGNANVTIVWGVNLTYSCQHGEGECWGNKYQV